jgi:hypothetical protein
LRRVKPCPPGLPGTSDFTWFGGLNFGVAVGSLSTSSTVTNKQQFSDCLPFFVCIADPTPNPSAMVDSSAARGEVFLGYNAPLVSNFGGTGLPLIVGGEGFLGFGSSSTTIPGIPGTGGIAPPSAMVHDSTTFKIDSTGGLLAKIGTVFDAGGMPFFITFDAGFGFARTQLMLNCGRFGACDINFIPTQTLATTNIVTGPLFGAEISLPLFSLPGVSQMFVQAPPVLHRATIGFEYLYFDGGHVTTTMGMRSQLQITAEQDVSYHSFMAKLGIPLGMSPSDIRLKRDIAPLRRLDNGLELYRFRYLWSDVAYVGVMAQEVERVRPDAVMRGADGYLRVNYDALGLKFQTYEEWAAADGQ